MENNHLVKYDLGESIIGFTTDRTIGRDPMVLLPLLEDEGKALRFARPHQTHGKNVLNVTEDFFSMTEEQQTMQMEGIDAVMSDIRNVCLGVSTADCIPVLIYDAEHHVAAAIHAGWRGTVQRIVKETVRKMAAIYGTDARKCSAAIGPGISQESFEVGWEVYKQFVDEGFLMDDVTVFLPANNVSSDFIDLSPSSDGTKPHIDLKEINRLQLVESGVDVCNIMVSDIDTFTDTRFFSARREQKGDIKCGRIFTGFVLR